MARGGERRPGRRMSKEADACRNEAHGQELPSTGGPSSRPGREKGGGAVTIQIVAFSKSFDRGGFDCGKEPLNEWLQTQASQQERSGITRTFLAVDSESGRVVGYYATTTYRLELDEVATALGAGRRRYPVPAVLLARLAVDTRWQGQGLGGHLLIHALQTIAGASRSIGFEVLVVHAIDREAVTFYTRAGFTRFLDHELHMYMTVKDLLKTLG